MERIAQTTSLIVSKPTDTSRLAAAFKLVRYELPRDLYWRTKRNSTEYGQMHNCLRDQLDHPYKTFKYDRMDRGQTKWVVYVLYPRDQEPQPITMPFLTGEKPLSQREISFADLDLHLLLKLLQIAYFRGEQAGRFIGQDLCYVHAKTLKTIKEDSFHICLQIELKGDIRNEPGDEMQEFKVIGHAKPFRRVDKPNWLSYTCFGRKIRGGKDYFIHLKRSQFDASMQAKEPIYAIRTREGKRTNLPYHDLQRIETSVGKLLYDFIRGFIAYLAHYGITCHSKERTFTELVLPKVQTILPLELLNPISLYDNRLEQKQTLQDCLTLFARLWPHLQFTSVSDLSQVRTGAVLIVQDHSKEDFMSGGVLDGRNDPYADLYRKHWHLPKQSISVNLKESEGTTADEYLDYSLPEASDEHFKQKLEMALYQLYLKDIILYDRDVEQRLPLAPTGYVFIRKNRYFSNLYETLLYFEDNALRFIDLRNPDEQDQRDELLRRLGVDWEDMYQRMKQKYRKTGDTADDEEVTSYDVIVGPNLFIELEDMNERVLYNYDEIVKRQVALKEHLDIDDLKLAPYYDTVRPVGLLSWGELQDRGLLSGQRRPKTKKETESLALYSQLEAYDFFLEEIQVTHPAISFKELTQGERMEEIGHILGIERNKHGHYDRRRIIALYQQRGWFSSDRGKDIVQLYEGIWYDQENCYLVGSPTPMNLKQQRAHLIRHFDTSYLSTGPVDLRPLLLATSVEFVRLKQYTVYPYPFHLIDLYVENVLHFQ